jgi:hypothetical protein
MSQRVQTALVGKALTRHGDPSKASSRLSPTAILEKPVSDRGTLEDVSQSAEF